MLSVKSVGTFCAAALELLCSSGYGIWIVTGAALACNQNLGGRSGVLVLLLVGLVFIATGRVGTVLSDLGPRRWRVVMRLLGGSQPRPEALLALVTCVIMLALAGLVRGNNQFWVTRVLGVLLSISCVITLRSAPGRASPPLRLRPGGLLAITFCGGLWFWFITTLQHRPAPHAHATALLLALLIAGLTAALSMQTPAARRFPDDTLSNRLAVLLGFAAPCTLLVAASLWQANSVTALLAVLTCQFGLSANETLHVARHARGLARLP